MHPKVRIIAAAGIPLWIGCDSPIAVGPAIDDYERVHLKIDASVIEKGDYWAIIEPVFWTANIYDGPAAYEETLKGFSLGQRHLMAIHWYRSEVNNGGHDQFYWNSTGIVWQDAIRGFEAIGLSEGAEIIRESAKKFSMPPSLDREKRDRQLTSDRPTFDDLDDRFYALEKREDLDAKMIEYARSKPTEFYFEGEVKRPKAR
jgi:hypothetical protein